MKKLEGGWGANMHPVRLVQKYHIKGWQTYMLETFYSISRKQDNLR